MNRNAVAGGVTGEFMTRRRWLTSTLGLGLASVGWRVRAVDVTATEESVRRRAAKVGLRAIGTSQTEHYLAIGDGPESFREEAIGLCEKLLASYQKYFKGKNIEVEIPARRMTVVVLAGRASYAAFKGEKVGAEESGFYDIDEDRLVIFDARGAGGAPGGLDGANSRFLNTFSLVHEAIHQLTFDTGMLSRTADVPLAVSEGLATYCELWQKKNPVIGQLNRFRLQVLRQPGTEWLPVAKLVTDDAVFRDAATVQAAYAEAWLLVHVLLKTRTAKFRAYLDLIRTRTDEKHRADDAARALGDLERLDRDLKKTASSLL